ncbi:family 2 glycosyl transferase [Candidatus Nitromaritima sp. SCGC AAA799-C22]|nr:family 2 glycosyl transferase [Candidatus Nitromaritima sp. SCGC AAA799-C22]
MKLSVLIPAKNEDGSIGETVRQLFEVLMKENIPHEILVVNDHSTDRTKEVLKQIEGEIPSLRMIDNSLPPGYGYAVRCGLNCFDGDCVGIFMGDSSDFPDDLVKFYRTLLRGNYDAVFGSRFIPGGETADYPLFKLILNRMANSMIRMLFGLRYNDITNAFKLYRAETIKGLKPFLAAHFNLTVELPLKVIVRGYSYTWLPNRWTNRKTGAAKLKINEMGSRYMFIILYCLMEKYLTRGDYLKDKNQTDRQEKTAEQNRPA